LCSVSHFHKRNLQIMQKSKNSEEPQLQEKNYDDIPCSCQDAGTVPERYKKFKERAYKRLAVLHSNAKLSEQVVLDIYKELLHIEMDEFGELTDKEDIEFMSCEKDNAEEDYVHTEKDKRGLENCDNVLKYLQEDPNTFDYLFPK